MAAAQAAMGTGVEQFRLAQIYSDSMVLQRAPFNASVWGYSAPGATVELRVGEASAAATADSRGVWRASLPPQPASKTPVELTASSGGVVLTLKDVLFGDVWLCSGQSNMAFAVANPLADDQAESMIVKAYANDPGASIAGRYMNATEGIAAAAGLPNIRLLVVGNRHECPQPIPDFYPSINDTRHLLAHPWARASSANIGLGQDVMGGASGGFSATCWYYGMELQQKLQVPIGLIHSSYGGSAVEDWISAPTLGDGKSGPCVGPITPSMGLPSQQYNGQLRPLMNTTIRGAIWYQGESNNGQDQLYTCRFGMMMDEWRREWHSGTGGATDPHFPIGFVQIGPITGAGKDAASFAIRMGQTANFGYAPNDVWPHSFMAAALDLGNPPGTHSMAGNIHIFNKQAVGHRLAVAARHVVYGDDRLVYSGPRVVSVARKGNSVTLTYGVGTEGGGLEMRSKMGFELCSAHCTKSDATWVGADVIANSSTTVTLAADPAVTTVRYGHMDEPSVFTGTQLAVYNAEGLPATPGIYNIDGVLSEPGADFSAPGWHISRLIGDDGEMYMDSSARSAPSVALFV
eukprot:TRINITY_DN48299_c0_g1_i1.p1 TRINITY_DN48299_c0_g1~~TRINITY_DN48299_c0_g1_i1.p1  ORF type:complete len:615 (-),score=61.73 TRINITY_DN48299_c0_g1_i1:62-1786(-)